MSGDDAHSRGDPFRPPEPREAAPGANMARFALEEVLRPLIIAALMVCIAISLGQFASAYAEAPLHRLWVWMAFGVSLESIHSYRLLMRRGPSSQDRLRFRFVEWVFILLLVRFGMYFSLGQSQLNADLNAWSGNVLRFFDLRFLANGVLALLFWAMALQLGRAMYELETASFERMPAITDPDHYLRTTMPRHGMIDRQSRINRIVSLLFVGGVVMLLLSGMAQVDVRDLMILQHSRSSGVLLNLLIYFLISFFLISQAQYATLKASWELQDVPLLNKIGKRWLLWFAVFLLIVGTISALLPVSYSVGLLDTIYTVFNWTAFVLAQIAFILMYAVSLLLALLVNLFRPKDVAMEPEPLTLPTPPSAPADAAGGDLAWWQLVRSLLFWAVLMGVAGYSLVHFMRDRWGLFRNLALRGWLLRLLGMWDGMAAGARRAARAVGRLRLWRRRLRQDGQPASGYISLRRLAPRDKVRYFYLSTLKRSAQGGLTRPPASTPLEFEGMLARELPDAAEDVHALTQAFVEARYTAHSISQADAGGAQAVWRRVKRLLTERRRTRTAGGR